MAITGVQATLANQTENLTEINDGEYTGSVVVPEESGNYIATVSVYDDSGNVTVSENVVTVSAYVEPKVDWTLSDRFNIQDYNRIKNNLVYIHEKACLRIHPFEIENMGENLTEYTGYWDVDVFNAFENNIEILTKKILGDSSGIKKVYFENGPFIDWTELNRIESATYQMKQVLDNLSAGLRRIPFRIGMFKGFRG